MFEKKLYFRSIYYEITDNIRKSFIMDDPKSILSNAELLMKKSIEHFETQLTRLRVGRANPQMLEGVKVDYYGVPTPIGQAANVNAIDAKTLTIQPFEKSMIAPIEKAIIDANLGYTPQNDGILIRINLPAVTEERRKALVKNLKEETEDAKVAIRNIRRDSNEAVKKLTKKGLPEDEAKMSEADIQKLTDKFIAQVDTITQAKEKEIMTV